MNHILNHQIFIIFVLVSRFLDFAAACGGDLSIENYGSISSPGFPRIYPNKETCYWLVKVPSGKRIRFQFWTFRLEGGHNCNNDNVQIYDGPSREYPLIGKYCGHGKPAPLNTSGNTALVVFDTDSSTQDVGFNLTYSSSHSSEIPCSPEVFKCEDGRCMNREWFCDGVDDCGDNSDEQHCNVPPSYLCRRFWSKCPNLRRCIPSDWYGDGTTDCPEISEELPPTTESPAYNESDAKSELRSWFLNRRQTGSRTDRWGSNVHRIAVALHLADNSTFEPGNEVGREIRYELTIQLLRRLAKDQKMSSEELALYIHALLVSCMNPRDFNGDDLVKELRRRIDADEKCLNPFLLLVLCNAGEVMTSKDLERLTTAFDSPQRPFWTDSQALTSMALSCIQSQNGESVDERILMDMLQELKRHQFRNGTVDNFRTTALVTQALFIHDSYTRYYDLDAAIKVLTDGLNTSKSLLNAYYILPVLHGKSLLNVSSSHCNTQHAEEEEALQKALDVNRETINVQYSVWFGDEINLARTWRLKLKINSTIYNAIETVAKMDNTLKVEYNVVDGKPYVAALDGKEDDPEMGIFWFIYLKTISSDEDPKIVEESPVDIKLKPNQEVILWHRHGPCNGQSS